ncbi:MAG TPA: hypothetical protein VJ696_09365, partial [Rhodanobacteraceae bacterium]|nr:hypothetical protein [Rhodanobacteraceae bacterium]
DGADVFSRVEQYARSGAADPSGDPGDCIHRCSPRSETRESRTPACSHRGFIDEIEATSHHS